MKQFLTRLLAIIGFALLTTAGAQIDVPMHPVPMTMQSFAVLLAGLVLGSRDGLLAVVLYLLAAMVGLPVLAEGASGLGPFTGPTAGYIYAFPFAAFMAGLLSEHAEKRASGIHPALMVGALFGLHLLLLGVGTAWLTTKIPVGDAVSGGFTPFLIGGGVKSLLCWLVWSAWRRFRRA